MKYSGDFTRPVGVDVSDQNYALKRCNFRDTPYTLTNNTVTSQGANDFIYLNSEGEGVDIVSMDTGCDADHPEFINDDGTCKIQKIHWDSWLLERGYEDRVNTSTSAEQVLANQVNQYYVEHESNHGTRSAAAIVGNTFGYAKKAHLYICKMRYITGSLLENDSITNDYAPTNLEWLDRVLFWHNNKNNGRPTAIHWNTGAPYSTFDLDDVVSGTYRGTEWLRDGRTNAQLTDAYNLKGGNFYQYLRTDIRDRLTALTNAGVHVVLPALNDGIEVVNEGHQDYNNFISTSGTDAPAFYMRNWTRVPDSIMVGAVDRSANSDTTKEQIQSYSNRGQGVDIYAPVNYTTASSSIGGTNAEQYEDTTFKKIDYSGTSAANPLALGLLACYISIKPRLTPAKMKEWFISEATTEKIEEFTGITNGNAFRNSNNRLIYNKFNNEVAVSFDNVTFNNCLIGKEYKKSTTFLSHPTDLIPDTNKIGVFRDNNKDYGAFSDSAFINIDANGILKYVYVEDGYLYLSIHGDSIENSGWEVVSINRTDATEAQELVARRKDAEYSSSRREWKWNLSNDTFNNSTLLRNVTYRIGIY